MTDPSSVWIYHERQDALLCGQHALNNLAQHSTFDASRLAAIAQQLDAMELDVYAQNNEGGRSSRDYRERLLQGSHHVDAAGNFSIEVLKAAVQEQFGIPLPHLSRSTKRGADDDICQWQGFLCHKSDHWFAIRSIGDRFWNLDSMLERPKVVTHFTLGSEMEQWQSKGYTVFSITSGLPTGGVKHSSSASSGNRLVNWHRMSDLLRGKSTAADPWEKMNGAGIRLDGRSTLGSSFAEDGENASHQHSAMVVNGLTDEEMLQLAMQASLQPLQENQSMQTHPTAATNHHFEPLAPEPSIDAEGVTKIQFRMPNGKKIVRRYLVTDLVSTLYTFMHQQAADTTSVNKDNIRALELRFGFPPKDLNPFRDSTIQTANLANETVQGRYL